MWPALLVCVILIVLRSLHRRSTDIAARTLFFLYLAVAILFIPARARFRLHAPDCEWTFDASLAVQSFGNYKHIILCAVLFVMTSVMVRKHPFLWPALAVFGMGLLAELEEGAANFHHCRMRDLIPDMTGAAVGAAVILAYHLAVRGKTE